MTVTVTTPTGHVGARVTRLLVQAGVRPRVLCRDPGRLRDDQVEVRRGDLTDEGYVVTATRGTEALLCVVPEDLTAADPLAVMDRVSASYAAAVAANGVRRVVLISSVGAEVRRGAGLIDGLGGAEERLGGTGAAVLALRCGYLFTNLLTDRDSLLAGSLTTTMTADRPLPWVDPRDVGDIAAARLLAPPGEGFEVQAVHGPEDLSFARLVAIVGEVLGHEIRLDVITDDELRAALGGFGMSGPAVEGIVGMTAGLRDGFAAEQPRDAVSTTPTTLRSWAYEHLRS